MFWIIFNLVSINFPLRNSQRAGNYRITICVIKYIIPNGTVIEKLVKLFINP